MPNVIAVQRGKKLIIKCPFCRDIHYHGTPYGHRLAHCEDPAKRGNGYILIPDIISHNIGGI